MRTAMVALAAMLLGCGGDTALAPDPVPDSLTGGWWTEVALGNVWQNLSLSENGRYVQKKYSPVTETRGAWSVEADGLRLAPDGELAMVLRWELADGHLRIWWPVHVLHEYVRLGK